MVTLRKRGRTLETPANPKHGDGENNNTSSKSRKNEEIYGYEHCRDERIKENLQRMQKLGIFDLSQKLKSDTQSSKRVLKKTHERKSPLLHSLPPRRSSRLQSVTPVSYVEIKKAEKSLEDGKIFIREGREPEIYTEEHDKLLGTCDMSWDLFQDGYDANGKRIYDPVKGKTCHQCRQKTLGHRTHCSKCNIVQGQFCGDCLYLRYGENVLEVQKNPDWICPVCRGICNCSLCRIKKGWAPTGALAKKVSNLGFKSVAHYLIQTRRSQPSSEDPVPDCPSLAKRSLAFTDMEDTSEQENSQHCSSKLETEGNKEDEFDGEKEVPSSHKLCVSKTECESVSSLEMAEKPTLVPISSSDSVNNAMPGSELKKTALTPIRNPNSIAGRLRKRPNRS